VKRGILGKLLLAMVLFALLATIVAVVAFSSNSARAGPTLPPNFARSQLVGGLASPTAMEFSPDGRLFLAEQRGTLRVLKAGGKLATFLDVSGSRLNRQALPTMPGRDGRRQVNDHIRVNVFDRRCEN
jgi:glucose/arabinose dehydrogenase